MGCAEASNEMVFKCLYCTFSRIAAMIVGWYKLIVNVVFFEVQFECRWCLIIDFVHCWRPAMSKEVLMDVSKCQDQAFLGAGFHRFGEDGIVVMVIHDHDVFVPSPGCDR